MVGTIGRQAIAAVAFVGDQVLLLASATGYIARGRLGLRRTIDQMAAVGADSLPIVMVTLLFVGMAWGFNTVRYLVQFGAASYYGGSTSIAIARELGPALCGVVVAARVGSAYAAQLGSMVVTEQIDALHALAVNPIYYLVVPRLVACVIMLPVLTVVADATGVLGAFLIGVNQGISSGVYINSIQQWMGATDLYGGVVKGVIFGAIIALVGCRQGLRTTGGAEGVGKATTSAVVVSIFLVIVADLVFTAIFYYTG